MEKLLENKNLSIINLSIIVFFMFFYGVNYYEIDFFLIEVFRELLTIPFILAAIAFSILGFRKLLTGKMDYSTGISFFMLLTCTVLIIISFF